METPTPTADPLDAIRAAYRGTVGVWAGWTWPAAPAGDLCVDGPGAVEDWDAWEDTCAAQLRDRGTDADDAEPVAAMMRGFGERCQEAAEDAAEYARRAVEDAQRGNLVSAALLAEDAAACERPYGVGSVYRPLCTALRAAERAEYEAEFPPPDWSTPSAT